MTTREYLEVYRPHPGWSGTLPVAGFVVALAAATLQTAWWFSHGWTWSNLVRFLASGQPVTWCVILILVGASLSWAGLRSVRDGGEGPRVGRRRTDDLDGGGDTHNAGSPPDRRTPAPDRRVRGQREGTAQESRAPQATKDPLALHPDGDTASDPADAWPPFAASTG